MPATTVKLETDLVEKVVELKQPEQSVSGYVRQLIEREHSERRHREAARIYAAFLRDSMEEREDTDVWEAEPLTGPIEPKGS
jgi:predicted CopG family antitoxin